ncbi:MAG: bifunctional glutamate N-acetyltransferase/amino-acid acetyltransferase ArgJ [Spirochaetes bacterium]|nr:bifunctional glutamate N-acetyltransferase/amino-acid acetyltransferase ArgJ [Spirochaetota bacterium]
MKKLEGGLELVQGYKYSAVESGIRFANRLDLCLISSDKDSNAAVVTTTNKVFAAPVKLCRERKNNKIRGILINSTNANACTGDQGYETAVKLTAETAKAIGADDKSILNCSTGIIGVQLPYEKISAKIPSLVSALSAEKGKEVSKAIMTTDTVPKFCCYNFETSKGSFKIASTAKGAGMIAPNMATLLCFSVTDAPVSKTDLDRIFSATIDKTVNALTIDGDMSTNDTAIILSPVSDDNLKNEDLAEFEKALYAVLFDISKQLVTDGEGATKCVEILVNGAKTASDAKKCAKEIAESLLVKTAFFGSDPNWGRVACAAGYSGAEFDPQKMSISFDDMMIFRNGAPLNFDKKNLESVIKKKEFRVTVELNAGEHSFMYLTSDISIDYVKINAEYST